MAFSNIDIEGIKGMNGNRNVGTKDAFCGTVDKQYKTRLTPRTRCILFRYDTV